ncbi:MAG: GNAT family N-acetyltransferase, partial [Planctomycetes bacterium]|nr:GNAT family N-acetyltransferase [Planctomycetota bacterium]
MECHWPTDPRAVSGPAAADCWRLAETPVRASERQRDEIMGMDEGRDELPAGSITVRALSFDEPGLPAVWERLLAASDVRPITQTFDFQKLWRETYEVEQLLLLAAERDGETVAIAPWFATGGMVFFLGVGEADYHDIVGAGQDADVVTALVAAAAAWADDFEGFKLHFFPEESRTPAALEVAASRVGLDLHEMGEIVTVVVDMAADPAAVRRAVSGSMNKREGWFRQRGGIRVQPLTTAAEVLPLLPEFFAMHEARWQTKGIESNYVRPEVRTFLERWVEVSAAHGWLRALRIEWEGRTLAMEFSWEYESRQYCGQWAFPLADARRSPGQVLLRHSVLQALDRGVTIYDQ